MERKASSSKTKTKEKSGASFFVIILNFHSNFQTLFSGRSCCGLCPSVMQAGHMTAAPEPRVFTGSTLTTKTGQIIALDFKHQVKQEVELFIFSISGNLVFPFVDNKHH